MSRPKPKPDTDPVLVSACLLGTPCRYNGEALEPRDIPVSAEQMVPVCPEELGGLITPREASFFDRETTGLGVWEGTAKVITAHGQDRTDAFRLGAEKTLAIARAAGVQTAYLKERSPSCGSCVVYLGETRIHGKGVTTVLLERNGIQVIGVE